MMHHAIDNGGGDHGIPEIIAEVFEVNVRGKKGRPLAVTAIDDLKEKGGIFAVLLLQPVKP